MKRLSFTLWSALLLFPSYSFGCDLCHLTPLREANRDEASALIGVTQQFTNFETLQQSGSKIENVANERLRSSITYITGAVDLTDSLAIDLVVPLISRQFRALDGEELTRGRERGLGDIAILSSYRGRSSIGEATLSYSVYGGIKLPTGDSSPLNEEHHHEMEEDPEHEHEHEHDVSFDHGDDHNEHDDEHEASHTEEHGVLHNDSLAEMHSHGESAIHGHDIALGSGSVDVPLGGELRLSKGRYDLTVRADYVLRTEGSFGYRYANDLRWAVTPSVDVYNGAESTVTVGSRLGGHYKRRDKVNGQSEEDTAVQVLHLGPVLSADITNRLSASIEVQLPLERHNSGRQLVVDNRTLVSVSYRF